ncbi:MAG: MerR family redox-sensitive transcriptional activator SoxR [Cellvibrionaceae bacterium]|jgi:MerR family redox-sensitive transcriptional activator SoxR
MSDLLIGEIAKKVGIATSAIRYYESIGLLPQPSRVNGRRRYDKAILKQLKMIRITQSFGWTLEEIRESLVDVPQHVPFSERWKGRAPQKISELELIIANAQQKKKLLEQGLNCVCVDVDDCSLAEPFNH